MVESTMNEKIRQVRRRFDMIFTDPEDRLRLRALAAEAGTNESQVIRDLIRTAAGRRADIARRIFGDDPPGNEAA